MVDARYPIGKFSAQDVYSKESLEKNIREIEAFPALLSKAIQGLNSTQLDTPYRDGGWTVRQVVHHVADSHMNAYVRMKWTLTEDSPLIKAYDEKAWAETPETKLDPAISLTFIESLHAKWTKLMRSLVASDLEKVFLHPETKKSTPLDRMIATYAWHGAHHLAHITTLKESKGWK